MPSIESLEQELASAKNPHEQMEVLYKLAELARLTNFSLGEKYAKQLLDSAQKNSSVVFEANAIRVFGSITEQKGDYPKAIRYLSDATALYKQAENRREVIFCNNLNGKIYANLGDYSRAMDFFTESLSLSEQSKDIVSQANTLNGYSVIYQRSGNSEKAEEMAKRSLELAKQTGDERLIAIAGINLGNAYGVRNEWEKAIEEWTKSSETFKKLNEEKLAASALGNLGIAFLRLGKLEQAKENILRCLEVKERLQDVYDVARSMHHLGTVSWKMGNIEEAKKLFDRALSLGEASKAKSIHAMIYKDLAAMLKDIGDYKGALEISEQMHALEKMLFTENMNVKTQSLEMRFEVERVEKENEIYRLKNFDLAAANEQITLQKEIIEQKNKDITDSILYAKRIQEAVLPSEYTMKNLFADFFVLYLPKDIVSGDFYWAAEKSGRKILAVADCTGHGVPGAIMSMMGSSFLSEIVNEKEITVPSVALGLLRKKVIVAMQQGNEKNKKGLENETRNQDGMDIVFCCFDESGDTLLASCANNPVWIVRDEKITEFEPDKFPVGIFPGEPQPFSMKEFKLKKGDQIYLFTDGYADQFGGPKEKKFGHKKMREAVLKINKSTMKEQKSELEKIFLEWKGKLEQVDDICIIGIRL